MTESLEGLDQEIEKRFETVRERYESYLKTSFYFKDPELRASFESALGEQGNLGKGPIPEPAAEFEPGENERALADEMFAEHSAGLQAALKDRNLHRHQAQALRSVYGERHNVVVATGTASGKTESFLYPILFELYRQHLAGELSQRGVRALILYPMNALANDQRERLGNICAALEKQHSDFKPTFGQYIGQTPNNHNDKWRNATEAAEQRHVNELVFREEMRENPPHILLTNYSMLEYLLIRPDDSPLFDNGLGKHWQFIVLDEAHQYRGAKGMEMGMLLRRLKQRLRDGGREGAFRCIATSATISSGEGEQDKAAVAGFAEALFGEPFKAEEGIIFGKKKKNNDSKVQRYHGFLRSLEGAFLIHRNGKDQVVLNRRGKDEADAGEAATDQTPAAWIEIALCRECGQHYYVGQQREGRLQEAVRDPSREDFGVDYYLPLDKEDGATHSMYRCCAHIATAGAGSNCDCATPAPIPVKQCDTHENHKDQIKRCAVCDYSRGSWGDPVQEIVHGADGPNAVIATALHELFSKSGDANGDESKSRILAFADSRQEAAFFAWYAEDSYHGIRDLPGKDYPSASLKPGSVKYGSRPGCSTLRMGTRSEKHRLFSLS